MLIQQQKSTPALQYILRRKKIKDCILLAMIIIIHMFFLLQWGIPKHKITLHPLKVEKKYVN